MFGGGGVAVHHKLWRLAGANPAALQDEQQPPCRNRLVENARSTSVNWSGSAAERNTVETVQWQTEVVQRGRREIDDTARRRHDAAS